jgi:hypothetical protein
MVIDDKTDLPKAEQYKSPQQVKTLPQLVVNGSIWKSEIPNKRAALLCYY